MDITQVKSNKLPENQPKALAILFELLFNEKENLSIFLTYAVASSLLYLAIPLAAQILVNTIAAGILVQPLIILSAAVLIGLLALGVLRVLQLYITEILQRKVFANISLNLAGRTPWIQQEYFGKLYAPELINRFFDTITIQKTLNMILLEVPASILQITVGLILMGIYNPLLLIFDLLLMACLIFIALLGFDGLKTSIKESTTKYRVAHWLEEIARCQVSFKMNGNPDYLLNETDERICNYLDARKNHFKVLLRQFTSSFLLEAVATASVLAIGGYLVINGQLSLGQLVASEIIILMILSALDKIIQKLESWYDLLTGIHKVSFINELETERESGSPVTINPKGAEIECDKLVFSFDGQRRLFDKINFKINPGARTSLVGESGSGKTSLAYLISGLYEAREGNILFNGFPLKSINLQNLRQHIALVSDFNEIFAGTVRDNITLRRPNVSEEDLAWAIEMVELKEDIKLYPQGLETELLSEGRNISLGQRQRILLARSIMERPQLLILDEAFGGINENKKLKIITKLFNRENPWTILNISHDAEVVIRTPEIFLLQDGKISEHGSLYKFAKDPNSQFSQLFPELSRMQLREGEE